ncbi:ParA family protein [Helicobacter sp. MIT 14-3879]|uniref:ParA family protein n=1 Tax=Helicobacter sp. MIT 14-3879 TaxID=2040649 RepID=UPI0015F15B5B|nr:ParA family protein [Helicobacter sp. MIT 14-3879]
MIITFSHPKGGVGKSTLCLNYLVYLQKQSKDFIVLDLDGQSSISNINKIRATNNLKTFNITSFKDTNSFVNFIQTHSDSNIIIDSGGFDSAYNRIAVSMSDIVLTPLSDSPLEIMRLVSFDEILNDIEKTLRQTNPNFTLKVYLVLNRINPAITKINEILEPFKDSKHYYFMNSIIRDRTLIKFSPANAESVLEAKIRTHSDIMAKNEILSFCNEIETLKGALK